MPAIPHQITRKYTTVPGTVYNLPHDEEERWRLTTQNNLFLRTLNHKVLQAPVELTDNDWILETASGTGIWLQDLAREIAAKPQYIGTDIESSLFPEQSTLPTNMRFETQSVLELPADWENKFTLAHQRLAIPGLRKAEWPQAINELYRVLKPGGWVQLFEWEQWTSGVALTKFREMLLRHGDEKGLLWRDLTSQLPILLEQSGFVNVQRKPVTTPLGSWAGQDGIDGRDNAVSTFRGFKTSFLNGGGYGVVDSEAEYDELVEQVQEEFDNTPGSQCHWAIFLAQKPIQPVQHKTLN